MLLPQVKARVKARVMRRRAMSQSLINLLRILPQQIQPRRQLQLLNRQPLILQVRHLLIRQRVILRVRRQLIRQPRHQRNYARVINHAPSSALK